MRTPPVVRDSPQGPCIACRVAGLALGLLGLVGGLRWLPAAELAPSAAPVPAWAAGRAPAASRAAGRLSPALERGGEGPASVRLETCGDEVCGYERRGLRPPALAPRPAASTRPSWAAEVEAPVHAALVAAWTEAWACTTSCRYAEDAAAPLGVRF